jgi:MarR family transcriptional regulator, organic hydroperoxide resistance regulator
MLSPRSLDTNILYLCGEVTHNLHRALTVAFRKKGIAVTVEQFSVLALLFYKDGINQQEISARLNRDKTTIARIISNMERDRMIVRMTDKTDTRGRLVFLTRKGRTIQRRAIERAGGLYMKALSGVRRNEIKECVGVLNKLILNINETT